MKTLAAVLVLLLVVACASQDATEPAAATGPVPDTFLMPKETVATASGLRYAILRPGTGAQPQPGQTVSVHYTGWRTDGVKVDSSRDRNQPLEFPLGAGRVIRGWEETVAAMKVGERRTVIIPPDLGYGQRAASDLIPPNTTLVFTIELLGVM